MTVTISQLRRDVRKMARRFRILNGWSISVEDWPDNRSCSWGGRNRAFNTFFVGVWDESLGPQPDDYVLHEVLHGAMIALLKMDRRKPKEIRQAEETLVQDICGLVMSAKGGGV